MTSTASLPTKATLTYFRNGAEISRAVAFTPVRQVADPWIALMGDCFFYRLSEDVFSKGPLHPDDCPLVISYRKGRINETVNAAQAVLPPSVKVLCVHLGANNLTSQQSQPDEVVTTLKNGLSRLHKQLPNLHTIVLCLLTPRAVGLYSRENPSQEHIDAVNTRIRSFNELALTGALQGLGVAVDFVNFNLRSIEKPNSRRFYLRITGFGPNYYGLKYIGSVMEKQIFRFLCQSPETLFPNEVWPEERRQELWQRAEGLDSPHYASHVSRW